jgi:DNA-binding transcriptional MerR regulator
MKTEFTAAEVSRLAGFKKPWMLAHLEREKTFIRESYEDRRHGRARKYTFADLLILRAINRMLELGARPARIRDVIHQISELEGFCSTRKAAKKLAQSLGARLFVTKNEAYLLRDDQEILDLRQAGQLSFGFMIDMHFVAREVASVAEIYSKQKSGNLKVDMPILEKLCEAAGL